MNHNKLDSSSAGVSRFGASEDGILYLVGVQSAVFISWKVALSPPCGVRNSVMHNSGIGIQVLATDKHLKNVYRTLKNSLLGCKDFRDFFSPQVFLRSHSFYSLVVEFGDFLPSSVQNLREVSIGH